MQKIASFRINHLVLEPGVYVSRVDQTASGDVITTYDVRMTAPNREAALEPRVLHAIEHLAATWLRNNAEWKERVVYWGPMGCCTGNYLILQGDHSSRTVAALMLEMFEWIAAFEGEIPGATARDCGNYTFMDLEGARRAARRYVDNTLRNISDAHLTYPE
jgi:S-ribosylhomocysteine lyase